MLEARNICLEVDGDEDTIFLLQDINFCIPRGHFVAIVGPSGCGKTTLLKAIAGIKPTTGGSFFWNGRDLTEEGDFEPNEIGYVPQFSIAHEDLTVDECVENAARLRVDADDDELDEIIDGVLKETGLTEIADREVRMLSGGQKRRLALAMELVSGPRILLCDEVTSGLDPNSETEIVQLLHELSMKDGRIVISVTHSLAHMDLYDSVMVLAQGNLAYHGAPKSLDHYFSVPSNEDVYPRLSLRSGMEWGSSWMKHRASYYNELESAHIRKFREKGLPIPGLEPRHSEEDEEDLVEEVPGFFSQFMTLLRRRVSLFFRDRSQLILQAAMIISFPILVALFSGKGQEQLLQLTDMQGADMAAEMSNQAMVAANNAKIGSAVSGIIMFEVILLGLMGANNAAREIAGERLILEKEKFAGVRSSAYVASKVVFMEMLVLVQSLWMYFFVEMFWPYRGAGIDHFIFLLLANAAMTSSCLGISACCGKADQASLLSIYLVGFQLPLSGAVLALPESIDMFTRPFISAFWAWSGSVQGLDSAVMKSVTSIVQTSFCESLSCYIVLGLHIAAGIILTIIGTRRERWES